MFIDDLVDMGIPGPSGETTDWADILDRALIIGANNVFQYFYNKHKPGDVIDSARDFPNVAPLSQVVWIEWAVPFAHKPNQQAAVLTYYERTAAKGWVAYNWIYGRGSQGTIYQPTGLWRIFINPDGTTDGVFLYNPNKELDEDSITAPIEIRHGQRVVIADPQSSPISRRIDQSTLYIACCAVTFAHCKGAVLEDHTIAPSVQKARARRGKRPLTTYKTIDIQPAVRVLGPHLDAGETLAKALHIVRGHFAHYTPERPLFGKITGTFYVPMHTRGTETAGRVHKRYTVAPPAAPS